MTNQRKRSQRPKLKKINTSSRAQWQGILKDIDKDNIPVRLLDSIQVNLIDGTVVKINIKELISQGHDPDELERSLRKRIDDLDHIIKDVDFFISIDAVADVVQPLTDEILKDL